MDEGKRVENIEKSLLRALKPFPPNETTHLAVVWLYVKWRLKAGDAPAFRVQLLQFIAELDERWEREPDCSRPKDSTLAALILFLPNTWMRLKLIRGSLLCRQQ